MILCEKRKDPLVSYSLNLAPCSLSVLVAACPTHLHLCNPLSARCHLKCCWPKLGPRGSALGISSQSLAHKLPVHCQCLYLVYNMPVSKCLGRRNSQKTASESPTQPSSHILYFSGQFGPTLGDARWMDMGSAEKVCKQAAPQAASTQNKVSPFYLQVLFRAQHTREY